MSLKDAQVKWNAYFSIFFQFFNYVNTKLVIMLILVHFVCLNIVLNVYF